MHPDGHEKLEPARHRGRLDRQYFLRDGGLHAVHRLERHPGLVRQHRGVDERVVIVQDLI